MMLYTHTGHNGSMPCRHTPGPIALRIFADYGPDFGWFAHCLNCFRDRPFTDEDIARLFLATDFGQTPSTTQNAARERSVSGEASRKGTFTIERILVAERRSF